MKYESNITKEVCPRCQKEHWTFIETIDEQFFRICESCLNPKERLEMIKTIRRVLGVKYNLDLSKISNSFETQSTLEDQVDSPEKESEAKNAVSSAQKEPPKEMV